MRKSILAIALLVLTFLLTGTASGSGSLKSARFADDTTLKVFGMTIDTDIVAAEKVGVPGIKNYVSARDLAEYLGYQVEWDANNKVINVGLYPQYGVSIDVEDIEKVRPQIEAGKEQLLSKFSTRMLDSFSKELAYYHLILDGDPSVVGIMLVEDYKGFLEGKESQFAYMWEALDAE